MRPDRSVGAANPDQGSQGPQEGDPGRRDQADGGRQRQINIVVDPVFTNPVCSVTILSGLNPGDPQAVVSYTCNPSATGNPANHSYAVTLRIAGRYLSTTSGPIIVDGQDVVGDVGAHRTPSAAPRRASAALRR